MKLRITALAAFIITPLFVCGQFTVVDDSWSDGDRGMTGLLDANWWTSSSSSGIEVSVGSLGLVTGTSGRGIHGTFAPQTLGIGDTITVTYKFTTPATVGSGSTAFRVALMDFNNAGLAADLSASSSTAQPLYIGLPGYMSDFDVNTDATADVSIRKHNLTATGGRLLGTTGEWDSLGSSGDAGYSFLPSTNYVGVFSVTRTGADSADIFSSLSLDGGSLLDSHTESDASGIANNFGMFALHANSNIFGSSGTAGEADNGIDLSNVLVTSSVPEPATTALLFGLSIIGFAIWRRRSK
jgi:hypothetical protein